VEFDPLVEVERRRTRVDARRPRLVHPLRGDEGRERLGVASLPGRAFEQVDEGPRRGVRVGVVVAGKCLEGPLEV
jgi:hypothetical protein